MTKKIVREFVKNAHTYKIIISAESVEVRRRVTGSAGHPITMTFTADEVEEMHQDQVSLIDYMSAWSE